MDAEALEPLLAVDGGDRLDDALHMVLGGGEIWRRAWPATPKAASAVSCAL
jgi:hypothetical protein